MLAIFVTEPEPEAGHAGGLFQGAESLAQLLAEPSRGLFGMWPT
jgi:hypothetical protein